MKTFNFGEAFQWLSIIFRHISHNFLDLIYFYCIIVLAPITIHNVEFIYTILLVDTLIIIYLRHEIQRYKR